MLNNKNINLIQKTLGYEFKNMDLLNRAFTHSSHANLNNIKSNERLEFLGDSVLHFATTTYLFNNLNLAEGQLSKLRAYVVSTSNLASSTKQMDLAKFVMFGKYGKKSLSSSIKADLFEAILGAIYLDSDYETAKNWLYKTLNYSVELFEKVINDLGDYKTKLQELIQTNSKNVLTYNITGKTGLQHDPEFTAEVLLNNKVMGNGKGKTKKEAENMSAKAAIKKIW